MTARTLNELMVQNSTVDRAIVYHSGEGPRRLSFADLYKRARGLLFHLQQLGAKPGDKLILLLNNNEQFLDAFWAAVLGGIVPVPVAIGISDEHRHKLLRIARKLGAPFIYTDRKTLERTGQFASQGSDAEAAITFARLRSRALLVEDLVDLSRPGTEHTPAPQDIAFIQFSSGSTSDPKGVVLTHTNLLAQCQAVIQASAFTDRDISLSWMPLTHDMGLIGFHLIMFAGRIETHLMQTDLFIRRPLLWLAIASETRATLLCSPNFGYRHYLKVLGERATGDLDLSAVRLIFNGAEPISVELCEEFLARLATQGLPRNAMYPVYGLAEATLGVTVPPPGRAMRTLLLNRHRMNVGETAEILDAGGRDAVAQISVGAPMLDFGVRIAGNDDAPLPDGHIGHIHIRGSSVTQGYLDEPAVNAATFTSDGWLRTGDLGLVRDGELYITGRAKEIIFVNGQNYYPHDLEAIAHQAPDMELGKVVAAGVRPPGAETDQLTVFVLYRGDLAEFPQLAATIARLINEQTGLEVTQVVPVKRIPKTTSGKIQRHLLEQQLIDGEFAADLAEAARHSGGVQPGVSTAADSVESRLLAICNGVLTTRRIGPDDNLFEIGASSLKLIEIHEQIDRDYPGVVDLTELFDHPTVAQLARHLISKLV